ncbi:MAG: TraQ conjugal transfer family protein, partial [Bacteroidota bacterium]
FDFNFSVISGDSGFVFESSQADFRVVPERTITTTKFNFSYTIDEGEGFFQTEDGTVLDQATEFELSDLLWKMNYIPTTTGDHIINVVAADQKGNEKQEVINYAVDFAPFTVLFNKGANTFVINNQNDLNLTVVSEGDTELYETLSEEEINTSYNLSFTVDGGTGIFIINGEELEPGQSAQIDEGTLEFKYVPSTLGEHKITLKATAPDGAVREPEITVNVENVQFFLLASTPTEQVAIGEDTDITLSLQTSDDTDEIEYTLSYFYAQESEGIGTLLNENGEPQTAGQPRPLEPGNYNYKFNSSVLGIKKIFFDVSDSNNQVKRDSVLIDVTSIPFTFSGQATGTTVGINQPMELTFALNTASQNNNDFNISFDSESGNGTLRAEDDELITPNTAYPVEPGVFKFFYTPTSLGEHALNFTATDNFGEEMNSRISFTATNAQLSFTASASSTEMFVGQSNNITVSLFEQGNFNLTYTMSYSVTGGIGVLRDAAGEPVTASQFFSVDPGTIPYSFVPEIPGNYTIAFVLRDSNGQTLPAETSFVVSNTDFQFTANEVNDQIGVGQANPINFNIVPGSSNSGATYTMTYESNGNGTFVLNGTAYGPGEQITVQQGAFQGTYTPSLGGSYRLDFLVTDSNGVPQADDASFIVTSRDFNVNAIATTNNVDVGTAIPINLTITETGGTGGTYTILISSTANGVIRFNGQTYAQGEPFEVSGGSSTFSYVGESSGQHVLEVSATASYGGTKDDDVTLTYNGNVFSFTATEQQATANLGEPVGISFNIGETIPGVDTYTAIFSNSNNGNFTYDGRTINPGQSFDISAGSSTGTYIAEAGGNHNLDFTVTSSAAVEQSDDASITIEGNRFTFSVTEQQANANLTEEIGVAFNIIETVPGVDTYTAVYTNNLSGIFRYDGVEIGPGQTFTIEPGNTFGTYEGQIDGAHRLDFTVNSS